MMNKKANEFKKKLNLFKNRKGMELQINFIVMIIIAIVVFGLGLNIAMKSFGEANQMKDNLDQQAENEILSYLNTGKVMSIGINRKEIKPSDSETFGLGLINKYGTDIEYYIEVTNILGVDKNNDRIELGEDFNEIDEWTFPRRPSGSDFKTLENNEKVVEPLAFRVPGKAVKGVYAFTVEVKYKTSDTGDELLFNNQVQKIYIEVI